MAYVFANHLRALNFYGYAGLSIRYHIARLVKLVGQGIKYLGLGSSFGSVFLMFSKMEVKSRGHANS